MVNYLKGFTTSTLLLCSVFIFMGAQFGGSQHFGDIIANSVTITDKNGFGGILKIVDKEGDKLISIENGKIKKYVWGKTQTVAPEYDKSIEKNLGRFFEKYHTMKLDNYIISDDEMERLVGSPVNINDCKHKRKE